MCECVMGPLIRGAPAACRRKGGAARERRRFFSRPTAAPARGVQAALPIREQLSGAKLPIIGSSLRGMHDVQKPKKKRRG